MQLDLKIDAQKFVQQVQVYNEEVEQQVQAGLDAAMKELSDDGTIEKMIQDAVKKNIMDSFSRWVFQSDIRSKIEKQLTSKMNDRIETFTTTLINELAEKLNLPKD